MTASSSPLSGPGGEPVEIDTSVAHMSRAYDYLLGGTTNFQAPGPSAGGDRGPTADAGGPA